MTAHVDPDLARWLASGDEEARMEAIVTSQDGLDDLLEIMPEGVEVRHRYRLIGGVAIAARAIDLRRLAALPMVKSIEPVRAVKGC